MSAPAALLIAKVLVPETDYDRAHQLFYTEREDDYISLRQVLEFIEREVAAGHAVVAVD